MIEVELDVLTGESNLLQADLIYDGATSLNPVIDLGQIQGCFMQGIGYFLREAMEYDKDGAALTVDHWHYKAPVAADLPSKFHVSYAEDSHFPKGVFGSKAAGEPPLLLSVSVLAAMAHAVDSARRDRGFSSYAGLQTPVTPKVLAAACNNEGGGGGSAITISVVAGATATSQAPVSSPITVGLEIAE